MWQTVKLTTSSCKKKKIRRHKGADSDTFTTIIWNNTSRGAKNRFSHALLFLYHVQKMVSISFLNDILLLLY